MKRPIITVPNKFGGEPFIEGTSITVADVQSFWRQPGVGAVETRKRFPELTEAELGAAVTYAPPYEPEYSFVAESEGPPRRRLRIWPMAPGWMFEVTEIAEDGAEAPGFDTWDETWGQILLYPESCAPRDIVWRDERSGEAIDIYAINPEQQT